MYAVQGSRRDKEQERAEWESALCRRIMGYVRAADVGEETRRRHDRLGAKLAYGQHWDRQMPSDRAAITANLCFAILRHKIAIMTKQDPLAVISPDDVGDERAARLMNKVIQKCWKSQRMRNKIRRLVMLANCCRTTALYIVWDPVLKGGAGDIDTDVIAPWNLIIDNNVSDPNRMEYAGHRVPTNRSRAMLMYPDSSDKIKWLVESNTNKKQGPLQNRGTPISSPWKSTYLPPPGSAIVNGKPVVTAFAGELISTNEGIEQVDLIEMYHRDHSLIRKEVPVRDPSGKIKQEIVRDEDGMPQFEEADAEYHVMPDGSGLRVPNFRLMMQDVTEERLVRKYPWWRRTTLCMYSGEGILLEDRPWDRRLPITFYTDIEPLDGILGRGSLLQTEHLQALVNVGLSTVTDTLRFGALCAWLAGTASGVTDTQIIPGIGQVIPVNDATQMKPVEVKNLDPQFFTLLDRAVLYMERVLGATGVMQGEAQGRIDSAVGTDTLAEIGGSTLTECTQRLETTISEWAEIVGEYAQEWYDERHAVQVEDQTGTVTWERVNTALLAGSFSYDIATGSTMAWSESAKQARAMAEYSAGLIDRTAYYEDVKKPNARQIYARIVAAIGPQAAMGPVAAPPPRTRGPAPKAPKPGK